MSDLPIEALEAAYPTLRRARWTRIPSLINQTFLVDGVERFVLQRLHAVFDPRIHENIVAVTAHLKRRGMLTPELVPTAAGDLWVEVDGGVWRLQTFVEGAAFDAARGPAQLASAGALVGRFHAALDDLDHTFVGLRFGVHDTLAHIAHLRAALGEHVGHRLYDEVAPFAHDLLAAAESLSPLPELPPRPCHGDLKLSNLLFEGPEEPAADRAKCLIDLDTLAPMALAHELGDAWRSWCNPHKEDADRSSFEVPLFEAAWGGYLDGRGGDVPAAEREALAVGVEHICLELTARFLADALNEKHWDYDPARFPGRGEHNLARARGQWALFESVLACRAERRRLLGV